METFNYMIIWLSLDVDLIRTHSLSETQWELTAVQPDIYVVIYIADDLLITEAAGPDFITTIVCPVLIHL